jgi:peptide-methionine (S)-S-oxide reductase
VDYALRLVRWSWIARECGVQIELIDVLLEAGASPDGRDLFEGRYGTALHHAVWSGSIEAVRVLVEAGADMDIRDTSTMGRPFPG